MFVHKLGLTFSMLAQRDVDDILAYTLENWGERQLAKYKAKMDKAFDTIITTSHKRKKIESGLYIFPIEKHRIFYCIEHNTVIVIRILHQRMDEGRHFP